MQTAPLWADISKMDGQIECAKENGDKAGLLSSYNTILKRINANYTIKKGKMTLYHGNVYNHSNNEIHELYKPSEIFDQRVIDVNAAIVKDIPDNSKMNFVVSEAEVKVSIQERWHNAPVEYDFVFTRNPH
jgi:hypothetical protein